ncbi:MAG: DUF4351 domain-containing protein [Chthonomonadaceae bacterium]|nr:DUF4351 domain-containing protein [Chthonomonadaceae bacterium]
MPELPIDHDRLFKELITTFFFEFLLLFAPQIAAAIDRDSIEFIDKEVFSNLVPGQENIVDILVKVKIFGEEQFILIHIENQSFSEAEFNRRMFDYFVILRAKFGLRVYPFAVFSFGKPLRREPDTYSEVTFEKEIVRFWFHAIQLNQMNWRDYLGSENPVATALMTKMQVEQADRATIRREFMRLFLTMKFDRTKMKVISEFMGTYLKLTSEENREVRKEIENTMTPVQQKEYYTYLNPWEEAGMERGLEQGIVRGIEQGQRDGEIRFALRVIKSKFGPLDEALMERISGLELPKVEDLAGVLINFQTVKELENWLDANA